jgi:4'-phosphopantetheinyl transferase EntD
VKRSLQEVLAESHIAAITIAILLFSALDGIFQAVWPPVSNALGFLFTAVAIFDIPYFSPTLTVMDRLTMIVLFSYLYFAFISLLAAYLVSRWVYRKGPLKVLTGYYSKLIWRKHA